MKVDNWLKVYSQPKKKCYILFNMHIQTSKVVSILQVGSFLKEEHNIGVTKKE